MPLPPSISTHLRFAFLCLALALGGFANAQLVFPVMEDFNDLSDDIGNAGSGWTLMSGGFLETGHTNNVQVIWTIDAVAVPSGGTVDADFDLSVVSTGPGSANVAVSLETRQNGGAWGTLFSFASLSRRPSPQPCQSSSTSESSADSWRTFLDRV